MRGASCAVLDSFLHAFGVGDRKAPSKFPALSASAIQDTSFGLSSLGKRPFDGNGPTGPTQTLPRLEMPSGNSKDESNGGFSRSHGGQPMMMSEGLDKSKDVELMRGPPSHMQQAQQSSIQLPRQAPMIDRMRDEEAFRFA